MGRVPVERIPTKGTAQSLIWDGDDLVDVVGGFRRWNLDGTHSGPRVGWGFPFDQVVVSPSGRFHVLYAERGTKALVLDGGKIAREINRSYAHAGDFDYPVAVGRLPDGREVLVHCPEQYNVIEIEELESGRRLTTGERQPTDVFHSRLSISPSGRHLLMAGWYWHPYGIGQVFDLDGALTDASVLDGKGILPLYEAVGAEVEAACWLDDDRIAVAASDDEPLGDDEPDALAPGQLGIWSIAAEAWLLKVSVDRPFGNLLACGDQVIAMYEYPQLLDPVSGRVIAEWPNIRTSRRRGSYGVTHIPSPIAAVQLGTRRLAVAQPDHIAVTDVPAS